MKPLYDDVGYGRPIQVSFGIKFLFSIQKARIFQYRVLTLICILY